MAFDTDDIEDDGDDDEVQFEVNIDPREDELDRLGIAHEDFEKALYAALDERGDALESAEADDVANTLEAVTLSIGGKDYRLGDLADVSIDEAVDEEFE